MIIHQNAKPHARYSAKKFIAASVLKFENKFDYSRVVYRTATGKVEIICPKHGSFKQSPINHLNSKGGCPGCRKEKLRNLFSLRDDFINRAQQVHGSFFYNYDSVNYVNIVEKVHIICPMHGKFMQSPANHIKGYGCPSCVGRVVDLTSFINKARLVHGNKYDYSQVEYKSSITPVSIVCSEHGIFLQTPANHCNNKSGCSKCAGFFVCDTKSFVSRASIVHDGKYNYSSTNYTKHNVPVEIICPEHGLFWQTPNTHLSNGIIGCPKCAKRYPKWEDELESIFASLSIRFKRNHKGILTGRKELDFLIPDNELAVEMCGLYWHSHEVKRDSRYHWHKYEECRKAGIQLVTIFEDEWVNSRPVVIKIIRHKLGLSEKGAPARACKVNEIAHDQASTFLLKNHLRGSTAEIHLGAFHNNVLVAVMSFGNITRRQTKDIELKRFVIDEFSHFDLANKMFCYFVKKYSPSVIVGFSDNRWFTGNLYQNLGFQKETEIPPDYYYVRNINRYHKSGFRKSQIRKKFPEIYDSSLTETEMMSLTPYNRIYDCGKIRWVWKSNN